MNTTSQKLAAAEQAVRTSFKLADSKAASAKPIPASSPRTPAEHIALAIKAEQDRVTVTAAVSNIRSLLAKAVSDAERTLADVRRDADEARMLADFIEAKSDSLPPHMPLELQSAARTLRGAGEAPVVASTLRQAAKNAASEIDRLEARAWLEKSRLASKMAAANKAAALLDAVGLNRKASAELLLASRYKNHLDSIHERSTRRRESI
jgi:hypothetical protein